MFTKSEKKFSYLFIIILLTELVSGSYYSLQTLHYIAKPAIIISLLIYFWMKSNHLTSTTKKFMYPALFMSLVGDILLMFIGDKPSFFMTGLIAFLFAHCFYIMTFIQFRNKTKKPILFITFLLVYAIGLFYLLKNGLGDMLIPVLIYMLVILAMSTSAFLRKDKVNVRSYNLVFLGAIFFMISDSLLALNKFYKPLPWSNITIMLTYAFAQISIVFGVLKQR